MHKFKIVEGGDLGVMRTDDYYVIEWAGNERIVFSFTQKGNAINAHFATTKNGLKHVKTAINDFIEFIFGFYPWCNMILAAIKLPSIERIVKKLDFAYLTSASDTHIYMRTR